MTHQKKILVAGGAGFLGRHLCQKLLAQGHLVVCVDNFSTGSTSNVEALRDYRNFFWRSQDITLPLEEDVDQIFNLACPASPKHYQKDPIHTIKTNAIGTLHLLELARKNRCRFLQASTSEIYGDPEKHPQQESYYGHVNPIGKRACYDEGKRIAETLCMEYFRCHKVEVRIARIFNTYGPYMHPCDGRVVSNLLMQALTEKPLTLYGDGLQTRSFCYVEDLIEGLILLMNSSLDAQPVNLGNPQEITIVELAQKILTMTGSSSPIIYRPMPEDDPKLRQPDITLAKKALLWEPKIPLEVGLEATTEYFKKSFSEGFNSVTL